MNGVIKTILIVLVIALVVTACIVIPNFDQLFGGDDQLGVSPSPSGSGALPPASEAPTSGTSPSPGDGPSEERPEESILILDKYEIVF